MTNPDGVSYDLTRKAMEERCRQLGVDPVPLEYYGNLKDYIDFNSDFNYAAWQGELERIIKTYYLDKPSVFNNDNWTGIEEGIVFTVERLGTHTYYKAKSPKFLLHDTSLKDNDVSDIEEES
jgi:hypothetical protein